MGHFISSAACTQPSLSFLSRPRVTDNRGAQHRPGPSMQDPTESVDASSSVLVADGASLFLVQNGKLKGFTMECPSFVLLMI